MSAGKPNAIDRLGLHYRVVGYLIFFSGLALAAMALVEGTRGEGSYYTLYAAFLGLPIALAGGLWVLAGCLMCRRRVWTYCVVIGAFTILAAPPIGTIIGIYTLVVLYRSETRSAFENVEGVEGQRRGSVPQNKHSPIDESFKPSTAASRKTSPKPSF
jgi:hypothetical protein